MYGDVWDACDVADVNDGCCKIVMKEVALVTNQGTNFTAARSYSLSIHA